MRKILVLLTTAFLLTVMIGCSDNPSEAFLNKYSPKFEEIGKKMQNVASQQQYNDLLNEIKPLFAEMSDDYSPELSDQAVILYAQFANYAAEYAKAGDAYSVVIERQPEMQSDSLLLYGAMSYFYSDNTDKAIEYMKKSLDFGEGASIQMKDYFLGVTLEEIMNKEGKEAADQFIALVKEKIQHPLPRFQAQVNAIALIGAPAPAFIGIAKWLNGRALTPSRLKGKVYLIDFWATWCNPCRMSIPEMKKIYNKFKNNRSFYLIGMTKTYGNYSDGEQQIPNCGPEKEMALIADFAKKNNMSYHIGIASDNTNADQFGVSGIPSFFLVGKDGKIVKRWVGYDPKNFAEMDQEIEKALAL